MITKQELKVDEYTGDVQLRNTFDISSAKSLVNEANMEGGDRNESMHCMGHIPPEMWHYDPWLLKARECQIHGDDYGFQKYLRKFFDIHTSLKIVNKQKYFNGWRCPT